MNDWTPTPASDIKLGDQIHINNGWQAITAVGSDGDNIVIYLGDKPIIYPANADVMVRTAEDQQAIERRHDQRMQAILDASQPWYLKLLDRFVGGGKS